MFRDINDSHVFIRKCFACIRKTAICNLSTFPCIAPKSELFYLSMSFVSLKINVNIDSHFTSFHLGVRATRRKFAYYTNHLKSNAFTLLRHNRIATKHFVYSLISYAMQCLLQVSLEVSNNLCEFIRIHTRCYTCTAWALFGLAGVRQIRRLMLKHINRFEFNANP